MLNTFVSKDSKDPLVCAVPVAVYARDHLLWVRRDYGGSRMSLNQALKEMAQRGEAEEEKEQLSISKSGRQVKDLSQRSLSLALLWST